MCVRIQLSLTRAKHGPLQAAKERPLPLVSQPQTRLVGVAEPSEISSRLVADVKLYNGSPLVLEDVATGRVPTGIATPKVAK